MHKWDVVRHPEREGYWLVRESQGDGLHINEDPISVRGEGLAKLISRHLNLAYQMGRLDEASS